MMSFVRRTALIFFPLFVLILLANCDSNNLNVTNPVTPTPGLTVTQSPTPDFTTPAPVGTTASPKPTVGVPTPSPTPAPTPSPVTAKPQELIMRLDQFPLPGFKVTDDLSRDEGQVWSRKFSAVDAGSIGYNWLLIDVRSLVRYTAASWIKGGDCVWRGSGSTSPVNSTELTSAPTLGDGTKACRFTFDDGYRLYTYSTGVRNIVLFVQTTTNKAAIIDSETMEFLTSISDRQLAIIEPLEPRGQNMATATGVPAFQFSPPSTLPAATAGKPYLFSFCQTTPTTSTSGCGSALESPSGGTPPYHFQVQKGFPPFGIRCSRDGTCVGTPPILAVDRTSVFTMCAIDGKGDSVCREVSLTVDVPAEVIEGILGQVVRADTVTYDLVTTAEGQPAFTEKMWVKGSKFRTETTVLGRPAIVIVDSGAQTMYVYSAAQNRALKTGARDAINSIEEFTPAGSARQLREVKLTVVATEVIDGKVCLVVESREEQGYKIKAWLWKEYGFPIRLEMQTPKGTALLEWKNIKLGNISDNMFVVPAEVEVTVVPPEGMPAALARLNPRPVTAKPQDLVMPPDHFPLPGFNVTEDVPMDGGKVVRREFRPTDIGANEYQWVNIDIISLDSARATSWIKAQDCVWGGSGGTPPAGSLELTTAPTLGDGTKACRFTFSDGARVYTYATGSRNVGLFVQTTTRKAAITDADALDFLTSIAERQLVIIDRIEPPFPPVVKTAGAPPFQFNPPAVLPAATAGKKYQFSFCQPMPQTRTSPCGPMPPTTTPTGGYPPYHFQYGTMGGFPPFGLTLGKDGHLDGTPHKATAGRTYRFTVCAVDLKGDPVCREVSLTVSATPTPTPRPTLVPTPMVTPTQEPASATIDSINCTATFVSRNLAGTNNTWRFQVTASGSVSGPVGTKGYIRISPQYVHTYNPAYGGGFTHTSSWGGSEKGPEFFTVTRGGGNSSPGSWTIQTSWQSLYVNNETEKVVVSIRTEGPTGRETSPRQEKTTVCTAR